MTVLSVWGFSLCFRRFYSVLAEMEVCHFGVSHVTLFIFILHIIPYVLIICYLTHKNLWERSHCLWCHLSYKVILQIQDSHSALLCQVATITFCCCVFITTKQPGEKRVCFMSQLSVHPQGNPGQELEAETMEGAFMDLLSLTCSVLPICQPGPQTHTGRTDGGNPLLGLPSSQVTLKFVSSWQKLSKPSVTSLFLESVFYCVHDLMHGCQVWLHVSALRCMGVSCGCVCACCDA